MPQWFRQILVQFVIPPLCVLANLLPFIFVYEIARPVAGGMLEMVWFGDFSPAPFLWTLFLAVPNGYLTHLLVPYAIQRARDARIREGNELLASLSKRQRKKGRQAVAAALQAGTQPAPAMSVFPDPWEEAAVWIAARPPYFWPTLYTGLVVLVGIIAKILSVLHAL